MASDSPSDSMETASNSIVETSSSVVEDALNISFENITYSVRKTGFCRGHKIILSKLCGSFNAGELSVIVGHSGAGKSTLMDILAGYSKSTRGFISVNGKIRNDHKFRRRSCYIFQNDVVQTLLTVRESLTIASELKLGSHISNEQKKQRVEEIIISLGLRAVEHTKARNLSGGQRKRLAIGLELVNDPPVMFLDEPTSGLDSATSRLLVNLLHQLARQGRTVVVTMHQPSTGLLKMVDRIYAIVEGRCAYMGSVPNLLPYLAGNGFTCPETHTPLDFQTLDVVNNVNNLVRSAENGSNTHWISPVDPENDKQIEAQMLKSGHDVRLTYLPAPKDDSTSKVLLALKSTYPNSYIRQFSILTRRSLRATWRDPSQTLSIFMIHVCMAIFVGILFWNINTYAENVMNNYHFLFYCEMFLMFTSFSSVIVYFPEQISVVRREHFNRWYSTGAYYLSTLATFAPTQTICTLVFTAITYYATGQLMEIGRVVQYSLALLMISYTALCLGLLNGSIYTTQLGVICGPLLVMPFVVFSGVFLKYKDATVYLQWIFHISFLKHGLIALMMSVFGYNRPHLICTESYCHYRNPKTFLIDHYVGNGVLSGTSLEPETNREEFKWAMLVISFTIVVLTIVTYSVLKIRLKLKW